MPVIFLLSDQPKNSWTFHFLTAVFQRPEPEIIQHFSLEQKTVTKFVTALLLH